MLENLLPGIWQLVYFAKTLINTCCTHYWLTPLFYHFLYIIYLKMICSREAINQTKKSKYVIFRIETVTVTKQSRAQKFKITVKSTQCRMYNGQITSPAVVAAVGCGCEASRTHGCVGPSEQWSSTCRWWCKSSWMRSSPTSPAHSVSGPGSTEAYIHTNDMQSMPVLSLLAC